VIRRRLRHAGHYLAVGNLPQGEAEIGGFDQQKADQRRFGGNAAPEDHARPDHGQQRSRQVGEAEAASDDVAGHRHIDRCHHGEERHLVRLQITEARHVRQRHETELQRADGHKRQAVTQRHACGKRQKQQCSNRQTDRRQPSRWQPCQQVADEAERKAPD